MIVHINCGRRWQAPASGPVRSGSARPWSARVAASAPFAVGPGVPSSRGDRLRRHGCGPGAGRVLCARSDGGSRGFPAAEVTSPHRFQGGRAVGSLWKADGLAGLVREGWRFLAHPREARTASAVARGRRGPLVRSPARPRGSRGGGVLRCPRAPRRRRLRSLSKVNPVPSILSGLSPSPSSSVQAKTFQFVPPGKDFRLWWIGFGRSERELRLCIGRIGVDSPNLFEPVLLNGFHS